MQKHTVSLCMIVKNEEKYLDKCLSSVQGKVDEIIIVDTGSTDRTIEIARKYNAVVKHFKWIDDFSAARNFAMEDAKSEYILVLDADEYLDESADIQKDLELEKDFYRVTIKNYLREGKVIYHQNVRLFKAGVGLFYSGKLHEHLNTYDESSGYSSTESHVIIHHVGYLPQVINEKDKNKRNYEIMLRELEENPTGYSYFNMATVYMSDGEYEKALEMLIKSYPLSKDKTYVKHLLVHMGECLRILKRSEEGIKILSDAIKVFPDYTDLYYTLGVSYMEIGYLRDAEIVFAKCLEFGEKSDNITVEGVGGYLANYQLALTYQRRGKIAEAFDESFNSITKKKSFTPALSLYLKLMKRAGINTEEIKKHLSHVYPVGKIEELKSLIYALYEIRHPLIGKFDFLFQDDNIADMKAIALMLDKQYEAAREEWGKVEEATDSNVLDVLVLSLLIRDKNLADKGRRCLNFSQREWKFISKVLLGEDVDKPCLTKEVEELLYKIAEYLLNIDELEQFEYISKYLIQCSAEIQDKLAVLLLEYNYTDTAMELLTISLNRFPAHAESYTLMGDAYIKRGMISDAVQYYKAALGYKDEYYIYEKMFDAYEISGDSINMNILKRTIRDRFPLSIWVKSS